MRLSREVSIVIDSFLDGITGAALFGKLRIPGAPTEFIDSRTVEEYKASGEFDETVWRLQGDIREMKIMDAAGAAAARRAKHYEEYELHR